jgi:putative Holliday junction resolvase
MQATPKNILALDVGERRIGVAVAGSEAKLARPLTTLLNTDKFFDELAKIVQQEDIGRLVVGLPRGLEGQTTAQTETVQGFAKELENRLGLPVHLQDEALTSVQAEAELKQRRKPSVKGDIDALAATLILEDYLQEPSEVTHV